MIYLSKRSASVQHAEVASPLTAFRSALASLVDRRVEEFINRAARIFLRSTARVSENQLELMLCIHVSMTFIVSSKRAGSGKKSSTKTTSLMFQ
jgi:hypothetical protein